MDLLAALNREQRHHDRHGHPRGGHGRLRAPHRALRGRARGSRTSASRRAPDVRRDAPAGAARDPPQRAALVAHHSRDRHRRRGGDHPGDARRRGDRPGRQPDHEPRQQPAQRSPRPAAAALGGVRQAARLFEAKDVEAIERDISGIAAVAPTASRSMLAISGDTNWSTAVTGVDNAYLRVRDWPLARGRVFTDGELRAGAMGCILGDTVRQKLFGAQDPLDATIRLGALSCPVIGVLAAQGQAAFGIDQDDLVLIPLRAYQRRIAGNQYIDAILVSVRDGVSTEKVQGDIELLLRERRASRPARGGRLPRARHAADRRHRERHHADPDRAARRGRRREPARRRDRHHEHHARLGDRAHARDRHPARDRRDRDARCCCSSWSRR